MGEALRKDVSTIVSRLRLEVEILTWRELQNKSVSIYLEVRRERGE